MEKTKSQADKFREAARQLECDDDQARFDEKLGEMVKPKLTGDSPSDSMKSSGGDG